MKVFTTAFCPPVEYFAAIAEEMTLSPDKVIPAVIALEACEHFQKQTYRNRCLIYGSEGPQRIQVPIIHDGHGNGIPIREVRVDYSTPWLVRAERAIEAAYDSSAYFYYYRDEFFAILDSRPEKLWDLNFALLRYFLEKTGIRADIRLTESYTEEGRVDIHPKRRNTILQDLQLEKPYFQVFSPKYGFQPNLSILDLLFNEGPESLLYLKKL